MCADAGFHADQARRYVGEPRFHLATRPFLPQHDGTARIVAHDVERVLADIDADHGDRAIRCLRHGVLPVFGAPCQLRLLAGQEHGRTIPLTDLLNVAQVTFGWAAVVTPQADEGAQTGLVPPSVRQAFHWQIGRRP